jgi:tetratricopeptide (TPR) repeat protein
MGFHARFEIIAWLSFVAVCLSISVFCSPAVSQAEARHTATGGSSPPTDYASGQLRILSLAAEAKRAFYEQAEPPIPELYFPEIADLRRDFYSVVRDYARESFNDAIDALVAEGIDPARAADVKNALGWLVWVGHTSAADTILTGLVRAKPLDSRAGAAALRHSVALAELPAALANAIKSRKPFFFYSKPLPPAGEKALPAYKHAADLDPGDAWTWIIMAILENNLAVAESAIRNAERAAIAANDWRTIVFSEQLLAVGLRSRGQFAEADRIDENALALARRRSATNPSDFASRRELARDLVWFGVVKANRGAASEARAAFDEALTIRKQLATSRPNDMRAQGDLVASYGHLRLFLNKQGLTDEAKNNFKEGWRLYEALVNQFGLVPIFNPLRSSVLIGTVIEVLTLAGVLTLILGLVVLAIYRHRITRLMRATTNIHKVQSVTPPASLSAARDIEITLRKTAQRPQTKEHRSDPISRADAALRNATWANAIAGCSFAAMAIFLCFYFSVFKFVLIQAVLLFSVWVWPIILTLNFLWGRDRRRLGFLILTYFGVLLCVCLLVSDAPPFQANGVLIPGFLGPLGIWGVLVSPTLFLLLFLNRSIRAIGSVLLVFLIFVGCGSNVGMAVGSMPKVMSATSFIVALDIHSGSITFWLMTLAGIAGFVPVGWLVVGASANATAPNGLAIRR